MSTYESRATRNDESRNHAEHDREPWSELELDVLRLWDRTEETLDDLAEMLGRTREACRQMFYVDARGGRRTPSRTYTRSTTVTTKVVTVVRWADDDEWPEWYVRG